MQVRWSAARWALVGLLGLAGCDGWFGGIDDCEDLFLDEDGDGFGGERPDVCEAGTRFATVGGDCDDSDASVFPGQVEMCNGRDDGCQGGTIDFYCDFAVLAQCSGTVGVYTEDGTVIWQETVPEAAGQVARGATRLQDGRYAVLVGTANPVLQVFDPAVPEWTRHTHDGWQLTTDETVGGIASWNNQVFAPGNAGPTQGIVRFDIDSGASEWWQSLSADDAPLSLHAGPDDLMYAVATNSVVEGYPLTDEAVGFWMPVIGYGLSTVSVTDSGRIFSSDSSDRVLRFDPQVRTGYVEASDIRSVDAHDDWGVVVGDASNTVHRTAYSLSSLDSFELPLDGPCFVAWDM